MMDFIRRLIGRGWGDFNWGLYEFLTSPRFVSLFTLFVMGLLILGSYPVWRKRVLRGLMVALAAYWIIISPPVAALTEGLLMSFVPADSGETADSIIVLGRGYQEQGDRYPISLQLLEAGRAPRLFVTGYPNLGQVGSRVKDYNVALAQVSGTVCARTTKDEALASSLILGPQGVEKIILVTDRPHMLRAYLTFQGRGFTVISHPIALSPELSSARRSLLSIREYFGLISYTLLGRLHPGSPEALRQPNAELIQDIQRRGCEVTPAEEPELFQASLARH